MSLARTRNTPFQPRTTGTRTVAEGIAWRAVWVALLVGACSSMEVADEDEEAGSSTGDTTGSTSSNSEGSSTGPQDDGTGEVDAGEEDTGEGAGDDGAPPPVACEIWEQDCGAGEKCMPWAMDEGVSWDATRCSPVVENAREVGDECTVEDHAASGLDTCGAGSMCWNVDPETLTGVCVPFCAGTSDSPSCSDNDTSCRVFNDGLVTVCLLDCDPLMQDCRETEACYFDVSGFTCLPEAPGDGGGLAGDPCAFGNACRVGHQCVPGPFLMGCESDSGFCCSEFCDTSGGDEVCSIEGHECVPFFEAGTAPAGYETAGYCGVPA